MEPRVQHSSHTKKKAVGCTVQRWQVSFLYRKKDVGSTLVAKVLITSLGKHSRPCTNIRCNGTSSVKAALSRTDAPMGLNCSAAKLQNDSDNAVLGLSVFLLELGLHSNLIISGEQFFLRRDSAQSRAQTRFLYLRVRFFQCTDTYPLSYRNGT